MSWKIFLVGMPACGKSYWGRLWAESNGWHFYDLDDEIEEREGRAVHEIIKEGGELYFRQLEHAALKNIIERGTTPFILASGGGTPIFHNNLAEMQAAGCVVYLEATIPELAARLRKDTKIRPFISPPTDEAITQLYRIRQPIYDKANFTVEVSKLTENTFNTILETCINQH